MCLLVYHFSRRVEYSSLDHQIWLLVYFCLRKIITLYTNYWKVSICIVIHTNVKYSDNNKGFVRTYVVTFYISYAYFLEWRQIGYRHFDTAKIYGSEEALGTALCQAISSGTVQREDIFVTSKLWSSDHHDPISALTQTLK